ncbi:MAG: phosphatidate cytidylyltransferase [Desulfobulbaceae bacterium]|nr:MAG: phosphatidate cytidylyltransferase [Desulfobulbaceae bacterium]
MQRLLTGIILGGAWLLLLLYGPPGLFWLVICMLALLALREYSAMLLTADGEPPLRPLLVMLGLLPVLAAGADNPPELILAALVVGLCALALLAIICYKRLKRPLFFLLSGSFGIFYLGLLPAHFPLLMAMEQGRDWLIIASLVAVAVDSGSFYAGTRLGRHKLCPTLSPGKTVEGLIGGVSAALVVVGLTVWLFFPTINLLTALFFVFILALVGVFGDLLESLLKRGAMVKDSGSILPGHGGLLDRIDSLALIVPLLYYLLLLKNLAKHHIVWFA